MTYPTLTDGQLDPKVKQNNQNDHENHKCRKEDQAGHEDIAVLDSGFEADALDPAQNDVAFGVDFFPTLKSMERPFCKA